MDTKKDIKSLNLEELKTELESMGEKAFRAKQMYEWMHVKLVRSFDEMTNLSAKFREQCKEKYEYTCVNPVRIQESKIDGTKKFLFELSDGNVVESVWMQYKHGNSVCISSQVGCRLCVHAGRTGTESDSFRDAGSDLRHHKTDGGAGLQCGSHGHWGTDG